MTSLTSQDGKLVVRDGKLGTEQACCCGQGCVPCACEKAVDYTFSERGKWEFNETPPEPTESEATAYNASDSCYLQTLQTLAPCQTCFDFDVVPDGDICVCGNGGCYEGVGPADFIICQFTDNPAGLVWWVSVELTPCMRLLCDAAGEYTLEVCQLQYCAGTSNLGRLTKRSFSIVLDETGCPESLGDELNSSVSDWYGPDGGCQWKPLTDPHPVFNIDSDYCNKDCWQGIDMNTVAISDLNPLP
jgi:hypothetical protein